MLKRFRKTIQEATTSPTHGNSSSNSSAANDAAPAVQDGAASGFICPMCMTGFDSPDSLQKHFSKAHAEPDEQNVANKGTSGANKKAKASPNQGSLNATEPLHAVSGGDPSLAAKQNADNGQEKGHGDNGVLESEISDTSQQEKPHTQVLNIDVRKTKAQKENDDSFELLQQQMAIAIKTNEDLVREKEVIMQKLATKSQEYVRLQSMCDELRSEKLTQVEVNENQSNELEKAAAWIRDLESQLVQRPGADDVLVLKRELVSVQTLMDQLTLTSEKEKDEKTLQCRTLQDALEAAEENHRESKSRHDAQMSNITEELTTVRAALKKEQHNSGSLEAEKNEFQQKNAAMSQEVTSLQEKLNALSQELSKKEMASGDLKFQIEEMEKSQLELQNKLAGTLQQLDDALKGKDTMSTEKHAKIEALTHQLEDLTSDHEVTKKKLEEAVSAKNLVQHQYDQLNEICRKNELEKNFAEQKHETTEADFRHLLSLSNSKNTQLQDRIEKLESSAKASWNETQEEKSKMQITVLDGEKQRMQLQVAKEKLEDDLKQAQKLLQAEQSKLDGMKTSAHDLAEKLKVLSSDNLNMVRKMESLEKGLVDANEKFISEEAEKKSAGEEVKRLQRERSDLLKQMEIGEGQAALVRQLKEENESVWEKLEESNENHKRQHASHEAIVKQRDNELAECRNSIKQQQDHTEALLSSIKELEMSVSQLQERDAETMADLDSKNAHITELEEITSNQKVDSDMKTAGLQKLIGDKTAECDNVSASLEALKTSSEATIQNLEESRAALQERITQLQQENTTSGMRLKEMEQIAARKVEEIQNLTADAENAKEQQENKAKIINVRHAEKIAQLESLLKKSQDENAASKSALGSLHASKQKIDTELSESLKRCKAVESGAEELSTTVSRLQSELASIKMQLADSQSELEKRAANWLDEKAALQAEQLATNQDLRKEHAMEVERLGQDKKVVQEEYTTLVGKLEAEITNKDQLLESKLSDITKLDEALASKTEELSRVDATLRSENADLLKRFNELTAKATTLDSTVANLEAQKSVVEEKLAAKEGLCIATEEEISRLKDNCADNERKWTETHEKLLTTEAGLEEMTKNLAKKSERLSAVQKEVEHSLSEKASLEKLKSDMESSLEAKSQQIESLSENLNKVKAKLESTEALLQERVETIRALETTIAKGEEATSRLTEDLNQATEIHKSELGQLKSQLDDEIALRKKENQASKSQQQEIEEKWKAKDSQWSSEKDELIQQQDTLKGTQQILINGKMELQKELEKTRYEMEELLSKFASAESLHNEQQKAVEARLIESSAKLEESTATLKSAQLEKQNMEARLQLEVSTLRDNLDSVRGEWQTALQQMERAKAESDELEGQVVVLQATVQNNADERRALLERCITAEQGVEQLRVNEKQLKRRLDDAQAAMHELGRENQAMQVKHTTVLSRYWEDDKTTAECPACQRPFSITLRKHHCRHCGKIFCADCSAKSTMVAASKKPVRVCEKCFDDLLIAQ